MDCVVKIKISLFIITKDNVSLITCDYVTVNLKGHYINYRTVIEIDV